MTNPGKVILAGAAGAWGDSSLSTPQLLADGRADYIIYEGLAEITMAILTRAMARDPRQGYARDLIATIADNIDEYRQRDMKVITNAGGVNPRAAADVIKQAGPSARVAVVTGDDILSNRAAMAKATLDHEPISANVYLGAAPIAAALGAGAEIVITGRVADSALFLGPLIHEFGWARDEYDLLSAGSLAGHLLECGPQSTGGLLTDWRDTRSWVNPGYPIAEVTSEGSVVVTSVDESDALVNDKSVAEQLLYEIGDPSAYLLPDVTCDWSEVTISIEGHNRVVVSGARGWAPPSTLKACAHVADGWRALMLLFIGGRDAVEKADRAGRDLLARGRWMLEASGLGDFRAADVEILGSEHTYGANARARGTREVILKIAVHHDDHDAVAGFVREIPSIGLSGPPGVAGGGIGLPHPVPSMRLECFPVDRESLSVQVEVDDVVITLAQETTATRNRPPSTPPLSIPDYDGPTVSVPLIAIAHGRSGDKGSDVNIGVRARHDDFYPVLLRELSTERVSAYLAHLGASEVRRYELPGIRALNFWLVGGLGSGGTASLRFDPQGKAVAQQLLDIEIDIPAALADHPSMEDW